MTDLIFALDAIDTTTMAATGVLMPALLLNGDPLLNSKGEPVGMMLHGSDSHEYRTAIAKNTRAQMKRARDKKLTDEERLEATQDDDLELLAACTCGWRGILDRAGNPIDFTKAAVKALYKAYPVLRDQVDRFIADRANFTKASSDA